MGAFPDASSTTTTKIICDVGFPSTDGSNFDSGNWIAGVLSSDGWYSGTPSGITYQNGFILADDDSVWWSCQYWSGGEGNWVGNDEEIGESDDVYFFARMDIDNANTRLQYKYFRYTSEYNIEHDICNYDVRNYTDIEDNSFWFGCIYYGAERYGYTQAGVEANTNITETNWYVRTGHFGYYNSGWKYKSCDSIRGSDSQVGGETLNADKHVAGAASVTWKKDSTPIASYTDLWTSSGTLTQTVATPFS